uniref:Zinc finger protein 865 n=1 Tax=Sphaeramia orbicularis TaxID=375764 RepID=A0A673ASX8_9TELE
MTARLKTWGTVTKSGRQAAGTKRQSVYPRVQLNRWRSGLAEHLTLHTQNREKPFSCSVCQKRFTHKSNLRRHLTIHTGLKLFSCEICDAKFTQKSHIRNHMVRHAKVKPFSCSVCHKTFTREIHVKAHMIAHSGKELFHCSICGAGFPQRTSVRDHMMSSHTENRPFKCSHCPKAFKRQPHLERHEAIHTGHQPFSCSVCWQKFTQKAHLNRHMLRHTEKKIYSCSICHKNFTRKPQIHTGLDLVFMGRHHHMWPLLRVEPGSTHAVLPGFRFTNRSTRVFLVLKYKWNLAV